MDVIGHDRQKKFLKRVCARKKQQHFFIFHGPEAVGKRLIATIFADALITGSSENLWRDDVHVNRHSDFLLLAPHREEKKGIIRSRGIAADRVRSTCISLSRSRSQKARVLLVDDAHEMTLSAQNAFLKTIEEPPDNTYIIFVTSVFDRLLPTVRSRATQISFGLVPAEVMQGMAGESDVDVELVSGRPGRLLRLASDEDYRTKTHESLSLLRELRNMSVAQRIEQADFLAKDSDTGQMLEIWIGRICAVAHAQKQYKLLVIAKRIEQARRILLTTQANKRLVLEDLLIHL